MQNTAGNDRFDGVLNTQLEVFIENASPPFLQLAENTFHDISSFAVGIIEAFLICRKSLSNTFFKRRHNGNRVQATRIATIT